MKPFILRPVGSEAFDRGSRISECLIPGRERYHPSQFRHVMMVLLTIVIGFFLAMPSVKAEEPQLLEWLKTRDAGLRDAQLKKRPVLVRFGAEYCAWCRKLDEEIEKPDVQKALKSWTLVELDLDRESALARTLNVEGIPALRVLSPTGRLLASQNGYLDDERLLEWLKKSLEQATDAPEEALLASGVPKPIDVKRIIRQFAERDAALRELAIRRLLPYPSETGEFVITALKQEKLAVQLAALELLREWRAPIDELDPWQPETLTKDRLTLLEEWVAKLEKSGDPPKTLLPAEQVEARAELDRLLTAEPLTALAIRERLARHRAALLPEVVSRLTEALTDEQRSRLLALRYRLVMQDSLAVNSAGLADRLASPDVRTRHQAVRELSEVATPETQPLYLELFADSDPLVRELSLLGLRAVAGEDGTGALVKLLGDPELNVRAAVLKVFAEEPNPSLKPRLIEFLQKEQDTGLLVHAVRCFRKLPAGTGQELLPLLEHRDWQVRAETLETLLGTWQRYPNQEMQQRMAKADIRDAVIKRLDDEDPFVVSRAIQGVKGHLTKKIIDSLIKIPTHQPSLLNDVIETLSQAQEFKTQVLPVLKQYSASPDPVIRAIAIHGLGTMNPLSIEKELLAALQDDSVDVRLAGARTLQGILHTLLPVVNNTRLSFPQRVESGDDVMEEAEVESEPAEPDKFSPAPQAPDPEPAKPDSDKPEPGDEDSPKPAPVQPKPAKKAPSTGIGGFLKGLFGGGSKNTFTESATVVEPVERTDTDTSIQEMKVAEKRDLWVSQFHQGKRRPKWMESMVPPLMKMFNSDSTAERLASIAPLTALGHYEIVKPVLIELLHDPKADPSHLSGVLEWLPYADRTVVANEILASTDLKSHAYALTHELGNLRDSRDTDVIWKILGQPDFEPSHIHSAEYSLKRLYLGDQYYDTSRIPATRRKRVRESIEAQLSGPRSWAHIVALVMLQELQPSQNRAKPEPESEEKTQADTDRIRAVLQALIDDETLKDDLRFDALQFSLATDEDDSRQERLTEFMQSKDRSRQILAIKMLMKDQTVLSYMLNSHLNFQSANQVLISHRGNSEPIHPELPKGVTADLVKPLMSTDDPEVRALVGYILALSEDPSGLAPLLSYRQSQQTDDVWNKRAYQAIAVLDDSSQLPILRQIYKSLDEWEVKEFYWTIRIMTGDKILAFRKQIRDEKGEQLK